MAKSDIPSKNKFKEKAKESLENIQKKISVTLDKVNKSKQMDEIRSFASQNKRDTIIYVILLLGLIVSLFKPFLGQAIIGIVVGLYFSEELVDSSRKFNHFIERQGVFRLVIFCFTGVVLLLAAPGIFLGAALAIGVKLLIAPRGGGSGNGSDATKK